MHLTFSQSQLARLLRMAPQNISRILVKYGVESLTEMRRGKNKIISFEESRKLTHGAYASDNKSIEEKIHVFYNFKGGTGKTTLCFQVASHLAILGFNVLVLDLDPQAHLSSVLGIPEDWNGPTIYDVLINELPIQDALVDIMPGLHLLPSNISMTRVEVPLSAKNKREERLLSVLSSIQSSYDYIIMDTNPTISTLNMNALVASHRVNIVCETQPFSLNGLSVLLNEMRRFYVDMKLHPNCSIIPNKFESKTALSQEVLGSMRSEYGGMIMNSVVRKSEEMNISAKKKLPLGAFAKCNSSALEDIVDLIHELVHKSQTCRNVELKQHGVEIKEQEIVL